MGKLIALLEDKWHYILTGMLTIIVLLLILIGWLVTQTNSKEIIPDEIVYTELLGEDIEKDEAEPEKNPDSTKEEIEENTPQSFEVIVDVKGAIHHPGVYTLAAEKRIIDAINQAGGLLENAESKGVNFAQILEDQMVIYIPEKGEDMTQQPTAIVPKIEPEGNEESATPKIDINTADQDALMTLNGIGSSKAGNIIAYREENGPFQTIEEIKNVSGIGEATFNNLKEYIYVVP